MERKIGGRLPKVMDLEPGTYWWCSCGRSQDQPWCDGSHEGTEYEPMELTIKETRRAALCTCKRTDIMPFCDGTHSHITEPKISD